MTIKKWMNHVSICIECRLETDSPLALLSLELEGVVLVLMLVLELQLLFSGGEKAEYWDLSTTGGVWKSIRVSLRLFKGDLSTDIESLPLWSTLSGTCAPKAVSIATLEAFSVPKKSKFAEKVLKSTYLIDFHLLTGCCWQRQEGNRAKVKPNDGFEIRSARKTRTNQASSCP